ncbi:hemicentin-1-like [Argopecten irradians]|uniref:hemicentin-1-like n=1 Tax=Argopecten irradians TaxID=31199 RepID=UPI0037175A27
MKTLISLVLLSTVAVLTVTAEHNECTRTVSRLVLVYEPVTYRYSYWGRVYTYTYYVRTYRYMDFQVPCPVNCEWDDWIAEDWTPCSVTCGKGVQWQRSTRGIKTQAKYGGAACTGPREKLDTRSCDKDLCPSTICKIEKHGIHTHRQTCLNFIHCENGKAHIKRCSAGTAWEPKSEAENKCTSKGLEACHGPVCERGTYYPHETNCSMYLKCDHNELIPKECPGNASYWDPQHNTCTQMRSVCDKSRVAPPEDKCDEQSGLLLVDRDYCNKYYTCVHGLPVSQNCAPGTVFNFTKQTCEHAEDVSCIDDEIEDEDEEPCTGDSPFPGDPKYYYQCVHGKLVKMPCPPGTIFDPETKGFRHAN